MTEIQRRKLEREQKEEEKGEDEKEDKRNSEGREERCEEGRERERSAVRTNADGKSMQSQRCLLVLSCIKIQILKFQKKQAGRCLLNIYIHMLNVRCTG